MFCCMFSVVSRENVGERLVVSFMNINPACRYKRGFSAVKGVVPLFWRKPL